MAKFRWWLASPPVAVSWGPDHVNVFAIFKDGGLCNRKWDGQFWNDWELLGGNYIGEPAVISRLPGTIDVFVIDREHQTLRHHSFGNDTWSIPATIDQETVKESVTAISTSPNRLELFGPDSQNHLRFRLRDGQGWHPPGAVGGKMRLPSRFTLSVNFVKVNTTRSLFSDTVAAATTLGVGNRDTQIKTQWVGSMSRTNQARTNLLIFPGVTIELAEAVSFGYLVVNKGNASSNDVLSALAKGGDSLNLESVSSTKENIGRGIVKFVSLQIKDLLTTEVPVVGSIVGVLSSWLIDKMSDIAFEPCDGVVAVELRAMMGRDLFRMTENGNKTVTITTIHPGTDPDHTSCGSNISEYEVKWTIAPGG